MSYYTDDTGQHGERGMTSKEWKAANPDRVREYAARYRASHVTEINAAMRAWRTAQGERYRAYVRAYYAANREHIRDLARARYRARKGEK